MREELSFRGSQLNQINTVFTVGYTIGQVPCNIALYYVKPRIFFPTCMVGESMPDIDEANLCRWHGLS
jgi:ACS family pantothenate transporter-like MFS transporter